MYFLIILKFFLAFFMQRIDILEALEAAVGNFSDGEADNLAFEVQHDFNE